jgi:hypothetical protein
VTAQLAMVLWSTHSPDLTQLSFVRNFKIQLYKTNSYTLEELGNNNHCEISVISGEELQGVNTNVFCGYDECLWSRR